MSDTYEIKRNPKNDYLNKSGYGLRSQPFNFILCLKYLIGAQQNTFGKCGTTYFFLILASSGWELMPNDFQHVACVAGVERDRG